ncbi:hypothetical protein E1B28_011003 [Marasmius oreades]|uniref:Protein kinase domain-containing protein n=1 Tax=Marasmius oreades TaxID=181124 RepID=A0A9P7RTD6_9AGAR|nr:uncharacterized protein E1B28_011003 [Marasmius oreades]KAG7089307.1 hypothetical protein E1B28_011003 [Marasmius oreades]
MQQPSEPHGYARFMSREIVVYLKELDITIAPSGNPHARVAYGRRGRKNPLWCKLVYKRELRIFASLKPLNPSAHHIATLLLRPYLLPTNQYLITMPDYGRDLGTVATERLCGSTIKRLAWQLCQAIEFLHSHDFCHLDIKPHNLAMNDESPEMKEALEEFETFLVPTILQRNPNFENGRSESSGRYLEEIHRGVLTICWCPLVLLLLHVSYFTTLIGSSWIFEHLGIN